MVENNPSAFIESLAIILISAGLITLLCRKLQIPLIFGYLVAGALISPSTLALLPQEQASSLELWSELGIVFLLFYLGFEFTFKKLTKVGPSTGITALIETAALFGLGFLFGKLLGWNFFEALFLGATLCISSTSVVVKTFEEQGLLKARFAQLTLGLLIFEDLVAILLIVLMTSLAYTQQIQGQELIFSLLKLGFFITAWFLFGIFLIPLLFRKARGHFADETLLIVSVGFCFFLVSASHALQFSSALGAFVMGSILGETGESRRLKNLLRPVRDLFAAVFFVSMGTKVELGPLVTYLPEILMATCLIAIGKTIFIWIGFLSTGQGLKTSFRSAMSMGQIGEFSLILATLGESSHIVQKPLSTIVIGISVFSTLLTPFSIRLSEKLSYRIENELPIHFHEILRRHRNFLLQFSSQTSGNRLLFKLISEIFISTVVLVFLLLFIRSGVLPKLVQYFPIVSNSQHHVGLVLFLILGSPFLWALAVGGKAQRHFTDRFGNHFRFRLMDSFIHLFRQLYAGILLAGLSTFFVNPTFAIILALLTIGVSMTLFSQHFQSAHQWITGQFEENLSQPKSHSLKDKLRSVTPWEAHLSEVKIGSLSTCAGKSLIQLNLRGEYGITIVALQRGHQTLVAPDPHLVLFPGDELVLLGTDDELKRVIQVIEGPHEIPHRMHHGNYQLKNILIDEVSPWINKTIRQAQIREETGGLVVGLQRGDQRILNPDSSLMLKEGDVIYLVVDEILAGAFEK